MSRILRIHEDGGPKVFKFEDVEVSTPAAYEVTDKVEALGLNRSEAMFRSGRHIETPARPARLGYDVAGVISAVRSDVWDLAIG
jgi:NADPH:quinone reductase-like Zn-dependent oxidoreductase